MRHFLACDGQPILSLLFGLSLSHVFICCFFCSYSFGGVCRQHSWYSLFHTHQWSLPFSYNKGVKPASFDILDGEDIKSHSICLSTTGCQASMGNHYRNRRSTHVCSSKHPAHSCSSHLSSCFASARSIFRSQHITTVGSGHTPLWFEWGPCGKSYRISTMEPAFHIFCCFQGTKRGLRYLGWIPRIGCCFTRRHSISDYVFWFLYSLLFFLVNDDLHDCNWVVIRL